MRDTHVLVGCDPDETPCPMPAVVLMWSSGVLHGPLHPGTAVRGEGGREHRESTRKQAGGRQPLAPRRK